MKEQSIFKNKILRKCLLVLAWLFCWQIVGMLIHNPILFATPMETAQALIENFGNSDFWRVAGTTLLRISAGFLLGLFFGMLLAAVSKAVPLFEELFRPLVGLMKNIPVVCFVVLFLIWWGASFLSIAVSFFMVFTAVYFSTLEGLKAVGKDLLEMAEVYRLPLRTKLFSLYRPALKPFLLGSLQSALGFAWKSGVAAEVIGLPSHSIGERIYLSKISLDTAGIFAWTVVVCVMSFLFERIVLFLMKGAFSIKVRCMQPKGGEDENVPIMLQGVRKSFDGQTVLKDVSMTIAPGEIVWLTWPSGAGKTTLLRILAGLEKPDGGKLSGIDRERSIGFLFQEDRLCSEESALQNVTMVTGSEEKAREALRLLLEEELWEKPCRMLSGGEKRRVALARALASKCSLLLLDEPFAGLDAERAKKCNEEIRRKKGKRTVLIASHLDLREKK
ncbi:MAG: ATP-binding cassette domain-containing protein [Lachnospiraceae bacterium]|nr:ATP-binding cassette domain-containing protein [Lachnospiraceae bacterium]